jgi:hypothetical protein
MTGLAIMFGVASVNAFLSVRYGADSRRIDDGRPNL